MAVFFVDDNFAINVKRTKSLLRDIIAAGAQLNWVAQISANLLRDEELVDLIAESGGKWIFIGMESLDPANLASVAKNFNKPAEYAAGAGRTGAAQRVRHHLLHLRPRSRYAGRGRAHARAGRTWPPVLPVFGQITPFPATPLYDRLLKEGRLTRPKHWLEFAPFRMAHTPRNMTVDDVQSEVHYAWKNAYSPAATAKALDAIANEPVPYKINHLVSRIFFRGIYFPPRTLWGWVKVIAQNRGSIYRIFRESFTQWHGTADAVGNRRAAASSPLAQVESGSD